MTDTSRGWALPKGARPLFGYGASFQELHIFVSRLYPLAWVMRLDIPYVDT